MRTFFSKKHSYNKHTYQTKGDASLGARAGTMVFRFQMKIRAWLLVLVALSVGPPAAFCAYTIVELGASQQRQEAAELEQRVAAAAAAVEQRLNVSLAYLTGLAQSDAARRHDLPALYDHAKRLLPANPDVLAITLISPDAAQVFNTLKPFGAVNPATGAPDAARRVFETGRPGVSGAFTGSVSTMKVIAVGVPLFLDGKPAYCLRMVLKTDVFNGLLLGQRLSPHVVGTIFDMEGVIVARTRTPENNVGLPAPVALPAALKSGLRGAFPALTRENQPVQAAVAAVAGWDWAVAISVPTTVVDAAVRDALQRFGVVAAFFLVVGAATAFWLAGLLARQVSAVGAAGAALRRGESPVAVATGVHELDELGRALDVVDEREQQRNLALLTAVAAHQQVKDELSQALCDGLTGLPTRAPFLEHAAEMRRHAQMRGNQRPALLFVDLDGFKQVNDTLGHAQGDAVLTRTAEILRHAVRDSDIAARLGGDEFVLCIAAPAESVAAVAAAVAERVVRQVAEIGDGVGCSVGVAIWTDDCADLSELMTRADAAMYRAKRLGKNRAAFYSDQ
jgi:diguanylate cyclase (GGDEF)-like protein